jgi:hypothetical protein
VVRCHRAATEYRCGIPSIALQLNHGATEGPPDGPGPVFPAGNLLGLTIAGPGPVFPAGNLLGLTIARQPGWTGSAPPTEDRKTR